MNTPSLTVRRAFVYCLEQERLRQEFIHPEPQPTPTSWAAILGEEFGEVCRLLYDHSATIMADEKFARTSTTHLAEELVQLAAAACRVAEYLVPLPSVRALEEKFLEKEGSYGKAVGRPDVDGAG